MFALTVTVTAPVSAPTGTRATIDVAVADCTVATAPLNFTTSSAPVVLKLVPVMVTAVLKGPLVGLIAVMVATGGGGGGGGGLEVGVLPFFEQAWAENNKIPKRMAIEGFGSRIKRIFV